MAVLLLALPLVPGWRHPGAGSCTGAEETPLDFSVSASIRSDTDIIKARRVFYSTSFMDAYRQHGSHSANWDKVVYTYLNETGVNYGTSPTTLRYWKFSADLGEAAITAGCDDPLVCYLVGHDRRTKNDARANDAFAKVYPAIIDRGYSGFVRFIVIRSLMFRHNRVDDATLNQFLVPETANLTQLGTDPEVALYPTIITEQLMARDWVDEAGADTYWTALTSEPSNIPPENRWLVDLVRAAAKSQLALITPDPTLAKGLTADAVTLLTSVQTTHPESAQPALWLLTLTCDGRIPGPPEPYLQGVASKELNTWQAYGLYANYVLRQKPLNASRIIAFAAACGSAPSNGNNLPLCFASFVWQVEDTDPSIAKQLWADPRIPAAIEHVMNDVQTRATAASDKAWWHASEAVMYWKCAALDKARAASAQSDEKSLRSLFTAHQIGTYDAFTTALSTPAKKPSDF